MSDRARHPLDPDDIFSLDWPITCIHRQRAETCNHCQDARDMALESERQRWMDKERGDDA